MTSALPPYPYFNGIGFNSSYFSSNYITQDQANKLYLLKAYPDKAIAKETFSAGIVASSITTNNGNLIMGTGQITCGNITSTSGGFGSGTITANGYVLNGTAPTMSKSSLGYYVNYDYTTSPQLSGTQSYYLYSPLTNSTTTANNYLYSGYYLVNVNSSVYEKNAPTSGVSNYTIAFCYGTTTSASPLSTTAQYGTIASPSLNQLFSVNVGLNNVSVGNALTCGFYLPADGFVNIQLICNITAALAGGSIIFNVSGCITRIA